MHAPDKEPFITLINGATKTTANSLRAQMKEVK
jgi:hypothetical protein